MALLSDSELRRIEAKYAKGISSAAVVKIFQSKHMRFGAATLRKYVQLGILPTSRRSGIENSHRGSRGLYPVIIVRFVNEIKRALAEGYTLNAIRMSTIGLTGEIHLLRRSADQLFENFAAAVQKQQGQAKKTALKRLLQQHRKNVDREIQSLHKFVDHLARELTTES